jgi:hypothetical protein
VGAVLGKTIALALSAASVETAALYSFSYSATTSYDVVEQFSGDHFYELDFPWISLAGRYCLWEHHCGQFSFDTGYHTPKQTRDPQLTLKHEINYEVRENLYFQFKPTIEFGGQTRVRACVDSIGRRFHCYFGTQHSSGLFFKSFDEIEAMYRSPVIRISRVEVSLTWVF